MIFAYDVLVGYISMRGSFVVHIPMCISMLIFFSKNIPENEALDWTFTSAKKWFKFGVFMHIALGILHFSQFIILSHSLDKMLPIA